MRGREVRWLVLPGASQSVCFVSGADGMKLAGWLVGWWVVGGGRLKLSPSTAHAITVVRSLFVLDTSPGGLSHSLMAASSLAR